MNLVLLLDFTSPMMKKTKNGKILKTFLLKFIKRINFSTTRLSILIYGENTLKFEVFKMEMRTSQEAAIFINSLEKSQKESLTDYRRRQPMAFVRKFLNNSPQKLTISENVVIMVLMSSQVSH